MTISFSLSLSLSLCMLNLFMSFLSYYFAHFRPLTLFGPMECSIKFHTVKAGRSIIYIKGSQAMHSKKIVFLSLKIVFCLS